MPVTDRSYKGGTYSGEWDIVKNCPSGQGIWCRNGKVAYEGSWENGQRSGFGTAYFDGVRVCTGNFLHELLHGYVTEYQGDGETIEYQGYYINGMQMPELQTQEQFLQKFEFIQRYEEEEKRRVEAFRAQEAANAQSSEYCVVKKNGHIVVIPPPISGLAPIFTDSELTMAQLKNKLPFLEDEEVPVPTNLAKGKTAEDWIEWVRTRYPQT